MGDIGLESRKICIKNVPGELKAEWADGMRTEKDM